MKKLTACLEAQLEDNLGVPEPPKPEKEKKIVVMQGPLSTTFALTLMKRFSTPEPSDQFIRHDDGDKKDKLPEATPSVIDQVNQGTARVDSTETGQQSDPPSLAMEMQMAFVTNALEVMDERTKQAQAEIASDVQRYRSYLVITTRSHFINLDASAQR